MVPVLVKLIERTQPFGRVIDLKARKPIAQEGFARSLGGASSRLFLKRGSGSRRTA
jgi:hypothetical protein